MLTLKLITEETDRVIRGLEKKHFKGAKEAIDEVLAVDKKRREAQQQLDKNLSEAKKMAAQIGGLMKEGKKAEADAVKAQVSEMKETNKQLEENMNQAQEEMTRLLCQIPNIPYDEVPEGAAAEDNRVVKSNLKECSEKDTVGNWDVNPSLGIANPLPHWELAKKYNLIDFDLGVKITGAGFPVYIGKGARLQRALINFFLDEARHRDYASHSCKRSLWLRHRSVARQRGSDVPLRGRRFLSYSYRRGARNKYLSRRDSRRERPAH